MSEPNNSAWPFSEITESEGFDIDAIFGTGNSAAAQADPFAAPAPVSAAVLAPAPVAQEVSTAPVAAPVPTPAAAPAAPAPKAPAPVKAAAEVPAENPIAAAFEQKTAENTKVGLLEKPPVFYHKGKSGCEKLLLQMPCKIFCLFLRVYIGFVVVHTGCSKAHKSRCLYHVCGAKRQCDGRHSNVYILDCIR